MAVSSSTATDKTNVAYLKFIIALIERFTFQAVSAAVRELVFE